MEVTLQEPSILPALHAESRRSYCTEVLRTSEALAALRSEWTGLYRRAPANPFLSHEWVTGCWVNVCPAASLFIVTARRAGRLVAVAPLRLERCLGFRTLRFIGKGLSPYIGFLADPDC